MILLSFYRNLSYLPLSLLSPLKVHDIPNKKCDLWFHMASLGEVLAARSLIELALRRGFKILITSFTQAGFEKALQLWGQKATILRFPWDSLYHVKKILDRMSPCAFIVLETELWPNTLYLVNKYCIPAFLVNARISERNFERIVKLRKLFGKILSPFVKIFAQTEEDAQRFLALGAKEGTVKVIGNIKIDSANEIGLHYRREDLGIAESDFVIVFSSLREKEENFAINLIKIFKNLSGVKFILAPRHLSRVGRILESLKKVGIRPQLWTDSKVLSDKVILINTLGELRKLYPVADLVIVGGTFAPYGGHNILEIAEAAKPSIVGPFHENIKNEVKLIAQNNGLIQVVDEFDAIDKIKELLSKKDFLSKMGLWAKESLNSRKGISERIFEEILVDLEKTRRD